MQPIRFVINKERCKHSQDFLTRDKHLLSDMNRLSIGSDSRKMRLGSEKHDFYL
jgi:hypothetical protein